MKRVRDVKKGNPFLRIFGERRGSSTLEYVIVIAAGALFASLLFWAVQSQEDVLREKVAAVLKGERLQVQPSGEAEDAGVEPSGAGVHRPQIPVNPAETTSSSPPLPDPGSGWADKAKEIPVLGWVVEKTEPLYNRYLKPFGESTGLGPIVGEVADFFDPTPALYELATRKDWETGEELGSYDHYVEPFLEYLVAKKVGKGGKLLAKVDNKLTGGKITHRLEEWTQPVKDKRDQFVEWACSRGGWFSERVVLTAYADPGGSKPDKDCLMQQVLGWSGEKARRDRVAAQGKERGAGGAAKGITRSLDDIDSLRGAKPEEIEALIPKNWIKKPLRKGNGVRFLNPDRPGEAIMIELGWPNAKDPLHAGPYVRISRDGKIIRIPLEGNPTLR